MVPFTEPFLGHFTLSRTWEEYISCEIFLRENIASIYASRTSGNWRLARSSIFSRLECNRLCSSVIKCFPMKCHVILIIFIGFCMPTNGIVIYDLQRNACISWLRTFFYRLYLLRQNNRKTIHKLYVLIEIYPMLCLYSRHKQVRIPAAKRHNRTKFLQLP